jgi:ubiquinone/menaquinone biosynthesis C-methylase UbiE
MSDLYATFRVAGGENCQTDGKSRPAGVREIPNVATRVPIDEYPFLCVDEFLMTMVDARSVATALELGLVDRLQVGGPMTRDALARGQDVEARGLDMLIDLLAANRVLAEKDGEIILRPGFLKALRYRDFLESRIAFAAAVFVDCHDLFTELLCRPGEFMARSKVFEIFRYDRAVEETAENYRTTAHWMSFTTGLTRYEAEACLKHFDFGAHRRMVDIGGNSGEFALRVCRAHPSVEVTVLDLPVVCEVGRDHVSQEPEADRITFHKGDARTDDLPDDVDLITFKSFLHDWPPEEARRMLARAADALVPGGTLLIFERGPIEVPETSLPYSLIPSLLFLHFYRSMDFYTDGLADIGLQEIKARRIDLDMPFSLITARKPI